MVNKKILFTVLIAAALPVLAFAALKSPPEMATALENLMTEIGAAIVVVGWVIVGILYLTSAGAPDKIGTAKKALVAAVIGTVVIIVAKTGYDAIKAFLQPVIGS